MMTRVNKNILKKSLFHSLLAIVFFFFYYVTQDIEGVRKFIGDAGYDWTIKGFSLFNSDMPKDKKIVIIKIDNDYLDEHNISDGNNGIRYNYTPRFVIANILREFDDTIKANHLHYPQSVFIDYMFAYSGDIDGKITKDDQKLIDALNHYAQFYDIYLPTTQKGIFLEKLKLHKNIHFVSANGINNSDDVQRGFQPYICQGDKAIPNVSIAITQKEIKQDENLTCPMPKSIDFNSYFKYRTLYKSMSEERISKWNNIITYSANNIDIIGQDFKNSIVLIGSDYENSGDIHDTIVGNISGVFTIANAIATRYYADGYIKMLNPWISIAIYFVLFFIMFFFMLKTLDRKDKKARTQIMLISMVSLFYIVSILILVYTKNWLNWIIPSVLYELILLIPMIKKWWHKLNGRE